MRQDVDRGERDRPQVVRGDQRKRERSHQIEKVGAELRGMMPFLRPVTITDEEVVGAGAAQNG